AIYNDANGLVEGNEIFQVVWLPDQKREELLRKLHDLARKHNQLARGQLIFEGNAPADVRNNELLQEMLRSPTRPAVTRAGSAWLGEALAIKGPTAAVFQRQTGSNLILVGQQDEPALGILTTALIGLAAQMPPEKQAGAFHVLDGTPVDSPQAGYWARVCGSLPHGARVGS